jgi:predicted adenine nucleotide alpha hydrolase (AANH) superfamily ATPase
MSRKILLHVCCGPCSTEAVQRLLEIGEVTLFFSNANIYPEGEYQRRLEEARKVARRTDCPLVEDAYDHAAWRDYVAGLEQEPEKGGRCRKCFEYSLSRAAQYAREYGFDAVTTSLTISPHKVSQDIFAIGSRLTGDFLEIDFKKKDGFRKSLEWSRTWGLYRQNYCGCEFSLEARRRRQ